VVIEHFPEKHAPGSIGVESGFPFENAASHISHIKEHFQERPAPEAMRVPPLAATAR
jgi:hypothetical protein